MKIVKTISFLQKLEQNLYIGSGIVSNFDKYPEHKKTVSIKYPKKKSKPEETMTKPLNHQVTEILTDITVSSTKTHPYLFSYIANDIPNIGRTC